MMTDFEIASSDYPNIREVLLSEVPDFAASAPYQRLSDEDRELPTVVCGAFARYLNRLLTGESQRHQAILGASFRAIEKLAKSQDPEVQNVLIVEVFEHLDMTQSQAERFHRQLGPAAEELYNRWVRS